MQLHSILCAIPLTLLSQVAAAQCLFSNAMKNVELNLGYNAAIPQGEMGTYANNVHGLAMRGIYMLPASGRRVGVGIELTSGNYASFTRTQEFGTNGAETPMDVSYNSNATNTSAVFRYDYFRTKNLTVFALVKGGVAGFSSRIEIQDPNDPNGCEPVDTRELISDHTWTGGVQTGANLDMNRFIRKLPAQTFMLQVYAGYLQGGHVDYINVKNTTTDDHTTAGHTSTPDGGRALDVRFINLQTGTQHSHEVARVYNSAVQFLECGMSIVLRF